MFFILTGNFHAIVSGTRVVGLRLLYRVFRGSGTLVGEIGSHGVWA